MFFSQRKRPTSFNGRLPLTNASTLHSLPRIGSNYRNNYHSYYNVDSLDKGNAVTGNFKQRQSRSKLFYSDEEDTEEDDDDINDDSDEFEHKELVLEQIGNIRKRHNEQQQNNHNHSYLGNNLENNDQENTRLQAATKSLRAFATTLDGKQLIMNGGVGGSSHIKGNHLSQLPFEKIGSSRTCSSNNNKLTPATGFHYVNGEDQYGKCQTSLLSQLSQYPINESKATDGITHQFAGTPSFFAQQHPTPPSLRIRHTRNDSCYSNNGLLSLGDEESNVGSHNNTVTTKQHSPQLPQNTKQCSTSSSQFSAPNSVPSTTKLRRSTSLRQHQSSTPTIPLRNYINKTGSNVTNGIINKNSNNPIKTNCIHSTECNETSDSSSFAKKQPNKHEPHCTQNVNNNYIVRNTRSGVNKNDCCYSHHAFKNKDFPSNNINSSTRSPSGNTLRLTTRADPETVSHNLKVNNPSSNSVTPLSMRQGKQRQVNRRSTSSPSPPRTGHETTSSHSSRLQKNEQHNKHFIPAQNNDISPNKHTRNGNYTPHITGAVNYNTNSRNIGTNEFRYGTHTRSSSASSFPQKPFLKGYQQDTITSIRRSRERRSQNSPSLSRIPSISRTPSLRRSEKTTISTTASNSKKCTTNKRVLPNMGNAVGSTASLTSSTCSGIENGQWSSYSSASNQIIQSPPESIMALRYENEKPNLNNHNSSMSSYPNSHTNTNVRRNNQHPQPSKRHNHNSYISDTIDKKDQLTRHNSVNDPHYTYQRDKVLHHHDASNKNNQWFMMPSNSENNFQRHGSYSSFHFGKTSNNMDKNVTNTGVGNTSHGVMSCLQGSQTPNLYFKPISKKNSASSFHLSNSSSTSTNDPNNNTGKTNKMNNNFLLRTLSLRKGSNSINPVSSNSSECYGTNNDTKFNFKSLTGAATTLFDIKKSDKYTLDETREDEINNSGPASLATSLPCLNNAILSNVQISGEKHRTNNNYTLSSNLCNRKGSLANKKKSSCSNNSGSSSTTKSSPSSTSTTPSSSSLVLNSLPYQAIPSYQPQCNDNNQGKQNVGSKDKQKMTLSASSSSGIGSSGSSGTSSPNQRTSGGTNGNGTLPSNGPNINLAQSLGQVHQATPAQITEALPKKQRVPITDDPEGHLAYLPGDVLLERYEVGK